MEQPGSGYRVWRDGGRAGDIHYVEEYNGELLFWWEFVGGGVDVTVPPVMSWDQAWTQQGKPWAVGRREEILFRLIHAMRGMVSTSCGVNVHDDVIELRF